MQKNIFELLDTQLTSIVTTMCYITGCRKAITELLSVVLEQQPKFAYLIATELLNVYETDISSSNGLQGYIEIEMQVFARALQMCKGSFPVHNVTTVLHKLMSTSDESYNVIGPVLSVLFSYNESADCVKKYFHKLMVKENNISDVDTAIAYSLKSKVISYNEVIAHTSENQSLTYVQMLASFYGLYQKCATEIVANHINSFNDNSIYVALHMYPDIVIRKKLLRHRLQHVRVQILPEPVVIGICHCIEQYPNLIMQNITNIIECLMCQHHDMIYTIATALFRFRNSCQLAEWNQITAECPQHLKIMWQANSFFGNATRFASLTDVRFELVHY